MAWPFLNKNNKQQQQKQQQHSYLGGYRALKLPSIVTRCSTPLVALVRTRTSSAFIILQSGLVKFIYLNKRPGLHAYVETTPKRNQAAASGLLHLLNLGQSSWATDRRYELSAFYLLFMGKYCFSYTHPDYFRCRN